MNVYDDGDYYDDGQYTNDIDLNGDGVLDPRDWEIGTVKFVNSHGLGAQDSGFCYMMYKCLADGFSDHKLPGSQSLPPGAGYG